MSEITPPAAWPTDKLDGAEMSGGVDGHAGKMQGALKPETETPQTPAMGNGDERLEPGQGESTEAGAAYTRDSGFATVSSGYPTPPAQLSFGRPVPVLVDHTDPRHSCYRVTDDETAQRIIDGIMWLSPAEAEQRGYFQFAAPYDMKLSQDRLMLANTASDVLRSGAALAKVSEPGDTTYGLWRRVNPKKKRTYGQA